MQQMRAERTNNTSILEREAARLRAQGGDNNTQESRVLDWVSQFQAATKKGSRKQRIKQLREIVVRIAKVPPSLGRLAAKRLGMTHFLRVARMVLTGDKYRADLERLEKWAVTDDNDHGPDEKTKTPLTKTQRRNQRRRAKRKAKKAVKAAIAAIPLPTAPVSDTSRPSLVSA